MWKQLRDPLSSPLPIPFCNFDHSNPDLQPMGSWPVFWGWCFSVHGLKEWMKVGIPFSNLTLSVNKTRLQLLIPELLTGKDGRSFGGHQAQETCLDLREHPPQMRRRPAGLSLLMADKQTRQTVPNKSPVSVCLGVPTLGNSPVEGRACRGHWARLVVSRFVFCTRTSIGTSNATLATLYCSSAEQFQELGWDLKSQSKSRGFCILAPATPHSQHCSPFPCTEWCWRSQCHL